MPGEPLAAECPEVIEQRQGDGPDHKQRMHVPADGGAAGQDEPFERPRRPAKSRQPGQVDRGTHAADEQVEVAGVEQARHGGDHQRVPPITAARHAPPAPRPTPRPATANASGASKQQIASPTLYDPADGPPIR